MNEIRILIVDDYQKNLDALAELIKENDIQISTARTADEALELISRFDFSLALLDVEMPGTNGIELAQIIRGVKKFKSLPIIFVTAHQSDSSLIFRGYQAGAVDLLFKPLDPNMVRAKVRMFVELANQRYLLQQQVLELERLRLEADAANIAKSQFLANMSHEIRTPLGAVMGFAELVAGSEHSPAQKADFVESIKRNGRILLRLIDDILDISKVEANKIDIEIIPFDLREMMLDIRSAASLKASEFHVELKCSIPDLKRLRYKSDPIRIKQIVMNIVGNAIKFSPNGTVDIKFGSPENIKSSNRSRLLIDVADNGIGLKDEQVEKLFTAFSQADASTKRLFGGSGLGLAISRQIARAMGGDVRLLHTKPNQGSLFQIELALIAGEEVEQRQLKKDKNALTSNGVSLHGKSILVVDDSPDNLILIEHYLKATGAHLSFAKSGLTALDKIKEQHFDLVLMDIQMPAMDGHETTVEMRKRNFKGPIVALTAHALELEKDKCKESGCDEVLTKPIAQQKLIDHILPYLT